MDTLDSEKLGAKLNGDINMSLLAINDTSFRLAKAPREERIAPGLDR